MKKSAKCLVVLSIFAILAAFFAVSAVAAVYTGNCGAEGNNLTYTVDTETGLIKITGTGDMDDYTPSDGWAPSWPPPPEDVNSQKKYCPWKNQLSKIKTVVIGDGVTSIGKGAFAYASELTSVTIGKDVTSIGETSFRACSKLKSITIPDGVTNIGIRAFYDCSALASITFETKNATIASNAFDWCEKLKTIYCFENSTADAFFSASSYTKIYMFAVSYVLNGGTGEFKDQSKKPSEALALYSEKPTKDGYFFKGWATSEEGDVVYAAGAAYTENADVTLYAVWEDIACGDVDCDGDINTKDAVLLAQYLAGWDVEVDEYIADCDGDGQINTKDAVLLAQFLAGWDVTLG